MSMKHKLEVWIFPSLKSKPCLVVTNWCGYSRSRTMFHRVALKGEKIKTY